MARGAFDRTSHVVAALANQWMEEGAEQLQPYEFNPLRVNTPPAVEVMPYNPAILQQLHDSGKFGGP